MRKTAIVTGASSGIGRALAIKLAENGYDLVITGRRTDRLADLEKELKKAGADVLSLFLMSANAKK